MSASTHRVGGACARDLITQADIKYCRDLKHVTWTTDDLADFVQGVLEVAVENLARLRPEDVRRMHADSAELHSISEMRLRPPS